MWRSASSLDDEVIVRMCLALNAEDPGPEPVPPDHTQRTLIALRHEPRRGQALVLEIEGQVCGYALLISYWSNELGGEACAIDEMYVEPEHRSRQHATRLIEDLAEAWTPRPVALTIEVTPGNTRARALYERLGFSGGNLAMRRVLRP